MKDLEKRRRVMQRSMRLGHCICDPRKPCPCDTFKEHDVCQCAGERLESAEGPVRLTRLVEYAGCASKVDQASLKGILKGLPAQDDPNVLIGVAAGDDAGVYRVNEDTVLVQTVDVFCPSVDDPYTFGQIAAANSVSDIYAMGGRPLTALSVVGFPVGEAPDGAMSEILRGGIDKMKEAGVSVIGGHSIKDKQVKAGFAVTGVIDPSRIMTNAGAEPGDALVLTKALGTGVIAFAGQIDRAPAGSLEAAASSMTALNMTAAELMLECGAHAATDVTGFGLMGHLGEMAEASGLAVEITWDDLPLLRGVIECLSMRIASGAVERNRESSAHRVIPDSALTQEMLDICYDAQTSGGLLVALRPEDAETYVEKLHAAGITVAAVIGRCLSKGKPTVSVKTNGKRKLEMTDSTRPARKASGAVQPSADACCDDKQQSRCSEEEDACCVDVLHGGTCCAGNEPEPACCTDAGQGGATGKKSQDAFGAFARAVSAPGAVDIATKQLLALSLSIVTRCRPCTIAHLAKARAMGLSKEEIDEAALMAVFFGGSPVMMFYNELKNS